MNRDVKISGSGCVVGGSYGTIKISGSGRVDGDVDFHELRVSGSLKSRGALKGHVMKVSGSATVQGNVEVKELKVSGSLKSGTQKIYADEIQVSGSLKNEQEINADRIRIFGGIHANEMFGDVIEINYTEHPMFTLLSQFSLSPGIFGMNRVKNIECSTICACKLRCETLSAGRIRLKSGCVVDKIYCNGSVEYDSTCQIGSIEGECTVDHVHS